MVEVVQLALDTLGVSRAVLGVVQRKTLLAGVAGLVTLAEGGVGLTEDPEQYDDHDRPADE
ncbi:hypothetical protein ACFXI6_49250 [Streptomyces mirabilis]|uniref:hypothetical protein n=1 Tax=Streptomyces mirabilis TaxID=68239 RepID=UPI00368C65A9